MTVALYVPGDRPDRFDKAMRSGADIVILDLEDAVAGDRKAEARAAVERFLLDHSAGERQHEDAPVQLRTSTVQLQVRLGDIGDLAVAGRFDVGLRVPKAGIDLLDRIVGELGDASRRLHAIVEDAAGVAALDAIAAHPAVASVALGESDLRSDLGSSSPAMLEHLRIRLVLAVRAAGLDAPLMSVYPAIGDPAGLEEDCRAGAALGFGGRTAVHPKQIDVIRQAFAPSDADRAWAHAVLDALDAADGGVTTLADGQMVDEAMRLRAQRILRAADAANRARS
ncbi:CoA ester lyase [Agrococcus sp. ProA11]|uniref:HpcH/HpaI aldolase/citrate lyase family protein n=1 Tax=Agrococcus chionoecetis TaxID=3153752 RepID=UPI00326009F5